MNPKHIRCPRCNERNPNVSSRSPGDGRPCYKCYACGATWSDGRRLNQGYKNRKAKV